MLGLRPRWRRARRLRGDTSGTAGGRGAPLAPPPQPPASGVSLRDTPPPRSPLRALRTLLPPSCVSVPSCPHALAQTSGPCSAAGPRGGTAARMGASTAVQPPAPAPGPRRLPVVGARACRPGGSPRHTRAPAGPLARAPRGARVRARQPQTQPRAGKWKKKWRRTYRCHFSLESGASPSAASCLLTVLSCGHCP